MKANERIRLRKRILGALSEEYLQSLATDVGITTPHLRTRGHLETDLLDRWERNLPVNKVGFRAGELMRERITEYLRRKL